MSVTLLSLAVALTSTASEAPAPVGVVRVSRGIARVDGYPPRLAELLAPGVELETEEGWLEAALGEGLRVRMSSASSLRWSSPSQLELDRGRVWLELGPRALRVTMSGHTVEVGPASSVVFDSGAEGWVAVASGWVRGAMGTIEAGQVVGLGAPGGPRVGGAELVRLVRRELEANTSATVDWKMTLLERLEHPGASRFVSESDTLPSRSDASYLDPFDATVEEALRPSPFSE